ncbi:hypothetical protein H4582DRAFT_1333868 [Lactarius indigo]|nr:hypothetical protein H4582DRAFT_1333868 [Lactarius indigo]
MSFLIHPTKPSLLPSLRASVVVLSLNHFSHSHQPHPSFSVISRTRSSNARYSRKKYHSPIHPPFVVEPGSILFVSSPVACMPLDAPFLVHLAGFFSLLKTSTFTYDYLILLFLFFISVRPLPVVAFSSFFPLYQTNLKNNKHILFNQYQ